MQYGDNNQKYRQLREKFPVFTYESYHYHTDAEGIRIAFNFNLSDSYRFRPQLLIPYRDFYNLELLEHPMFENLVFHTGLVELVSYWKTSCSPLIKIIPFHLDQQQQEWWRNLYFNGLGEFFYLNGIHPDIFDIVTFECGTDKLPSNSDMITKEKYIVPVGGGKDSVVTLELLKEEQLIPMIINPLKASLDTAKTAGYPIGKIMEVQRSIDPVLLDMNAAGFLNGHTPFSALVSFISMIGAVLTGSNKIALSNESSANESTIPGTHINHQYSKSFEYEQQFREYTGKYISGSIKYFSFLRPLNEFQIAGIFSGYPAYAKLFRSCNAGSKKNSWCGKCPKCLFTYIILSPFIEADKLKNIFGKDLLNDKGLYHPFLELTGYAQHKPFECVGTIREVRGSLDILIRRSGDSSLPYLIEVYKDKRQKNGIVQPEEVDHGAYYNPDHNLDDKDLAKIREAMHV